MNTAAIGTTFTILGSLAYAAGQGAAPRPQPAGAVTRSPVHEDVAVSQRHQGTTMAALAGGGESCTIGEPLNWFTQVHPMPECAIHVWRYSRLNSGTIYEDVDGDGSKDTLSMMRYTIDQDGISGYQAAESLAISSGSNNADWACCIGSHVLFQVRTHVGEGGTSLTLNPVMAGARLEEALCQLIDCTKVVNHNIFPVDLIDMDGDGDLDLVVQLSWENPANYDWQYRVVWIENTAKVNPPLAADINRDGVVDGKDLASVLSAWTP
jgi:hypothetical protein